MNTDKDQYLLKIKDGRHVTARLDREMNLCAVETQDEVQNGQRVCIVPNPKKPTKKQVAFFFKRQNSYYSPKVEGGMLKFQRTRYIKDTVSECQWFEKVNLGNGDHYGLRSVVGSKPYLCPPNDDSSSFFLSENRQQCVLVKHEKI